MLLIAGSILLLIAIKGRAVRLAGAGVIVCSSLLGASVGSTVSVSCYLMTTVFSFRSPRTVVRRKALLARYNAAGVISDAAYDRSIAAIDLTDLDAPTTAPAADRRPQPSEPGNRAAGSASD